MPQEVRLSSSDCPESLVSSAGGGGGVEPVVTEMRTRGLGIPGWEALTAPQSSEVERRAGAAPGRLTGTSTRRWLLLARAPTATLPG